jgi:hypothetical protein
MLWLGLAVAESMAAEQYEQPTERQAAAVLPPEMVTGPYHRMLDPVVPYRYMDHFIIESPFGHFEVGGWRLAEAPQRTPRHRGLARDQDE